MTHHSSLVRASFEIPDDRAAAEPPEMRGLERDGVRLLVAGPSGTSHTTFKEISRYLRRGDLVVVNTSATLPAAIEGERRAGRRVAVHFSNLLDDGTWTVELRSPDASGPLLDGTSGERIRLEGGAQLEILSAHSGPEGRSRLVRVTTTTDCVEEYLEAFGRPIAYTYSKGRHPLSMYQTVFARDPGSAEMPSAGRPFTTDLVTRMVTQGIVFAPILLHAGVSSLERGESPLPERYRVAAETARLVNETRRAGGSVIAVGTTVTRALETVTDEDGSVRPGEGWTDLVLSPARRARAVDGLITGWHTSDASHQLLLEAVAGGDLVDRAYAAALRTGYLWHEFGDSCLLLPTRGAPDEGQPTRIP
ncbi:MAG: S-adenosylmethionine:tRNA ribosyltransferase-isomerase [Actinomycetota bacterium]|nr:S-adenosylmethionine:tRNA ribosyltransferase-isomerase [Actinomycetota bacterium]